jgi:methionyl aminopeptidase
MIFVKPLPVYLEATNLIPMPLIKTPEEIAILKEGGAILSETLRAVREACVAGVTSEELDRMAQDLLAKRGATPSFLGYRVDPRGSAYPGALCVSINEEVVHGLPVPSRTIEDGDIVGLDIGCWYKGLCTDMASSVCVGKVEPRIRELAEDTRAALAKGIGTVRAGAPISDIGAAIEDFLAPKGYGIVKDLVGHGVGHAVHEAPQIPNYREPRAPKVVMKAGMVLAIEPMITLGTWKVRQLDDGWTIVTIDGSPCAHFELTVAVTDKGCDIVTPWPDA